MDINLVCDYMIDRLRSGEVRLNHLKLQKLVYYVQAWHLAFYGSPLFAGKFQAWVHGPVSRELYDRFSSTKSLYSPILREDIRSPESLSLISEENRRHIDSVLEVYASFTDTQLEEMTHREDPWVKAREGYAPNERCEQEIDERLMQTYYAARVNG